MGQNKKFVTESEKTKHRLKTYTAQFLAACGFVQLLPHDPTQFICPFCGNGSGENGTGISTDYTNDDGEYSYHCFRCNKNFDNIDIAKNALGNLPFRETIQKALAIIDGKIKDGVSPNIHYSGEVEEQSDEPEEIKDYTTFYEQCEARLIYYIQSQYPQDYRGLELSTLQHFNVGYTPDWGTPPTPRIIIPYNKNHYLARYVGTDEMLTRPEYIGRVRIKQHSKGKGLKSVFNLDKVKAMRRREFQESWKDRPITAFETNNGLGTPILLVEGEIDAMTAYQLTGGKIPVVAIGGATIPKTMDDVLKACEDFPSSVFMVMLDNDKAGIEAAPAVAQRLIELGHYAVIWRYARTNIHSVYHKCTKFKESDNYDPSWTYSNETFVSAKDSFERITGYRNKQIKDINDAIQYGNRSEAQKVLYYAFELTSVLSGLFGTCNDDFLSMRPEYFSDYHKDREITASRRAWILHRIAEDSIKSNNYIDASNQPVKVSDLDFELFFVPDENDHPPFCVATSQKKWISHKRKMAFSPYWLEIAQNDDGEFFYQSTLYEKSAAEIEAEQLEEEVKGMKDAFEQDNQTTDNETPAEDDAVDVTNATELRANVTSTDDETPAEDDAVDVTKMTAGDTNSSDNSQNHYKSYTQEIIETCPINLKIPTMYKMLEFGIQLRKSGEIICRTPVVPTKTFWDADTQNHSTELAILDRRTGKWQTVIADNETILDPTKIIKLTNKGLLMTKKQAQLVSTYLLDMIDLNQSEIPREELYSIPGWTDDKCTEFLYPEIPVKGKVLNVQGNFFKKKFITGGDYSAWRERITSYVTGKFNMAVFYFILGMALSAPILRPLQARNSQALLWCQSGSGKSALMKSVMSVYGRPEGLKNTFNATLNSLNDLPKNFNDFPTWIDEFQTATKQIRESIAQNVYGFELGKTRMRLEKSSAMRRIEELKGTRLMTGEQPLLAESVDAGAFNRLLQISYNQLFAPGTDIAEVHNFFDTNFGFFGPEWCKHVSQSEVQKALKKTYAENKAEFRSIGKAASWTDNWCDVTAVVKSALDHALPLIVDDFDESDFLGRFCAAIDIISQDIPKDKSITTSQRALSQLEDYINSHPKNFMVEINRPNGRTMVKEMVGGDSGTGFVEQGYIFYDKSVGITQTELQNILVKELQFNSLEGILRGWADEGVIAISNNNAKTHKYTVVKEMPKPFYKSRRLVLFKVDTLNVEVVPRTARIIDGADNDSSDNDEE